MYHAAIKLFDSVIKGNFDFELPVNPLNTDGIDPDGKNMTFRRIKITNFDDVIVPKPSTNISQFTDCTQDILIEDIEVVYGIGISMGSVPPDAMHNCIKDVTVRNVHFMTPFDAIRIKTNPGEVGTGLVQNITYENISIDFPLWWGIYVGPQYCPYYPYGEHCETQPLVTIKDITLRNVTSSGGLLPAGTLRCNEANPCLNFLFEDVQVHAPFWDLFKHGFITENVHGKSLRVHPDPHFQV